ncbi:penicillin-binding transpeptidase domain-containing protein [Pseudobdellovibrio exovorus]|uniref:Cell division protein n=1 Tax=Pseudobdellovibrio exovorus JSS TaxID=1184267 RepID=M4VDY0_9BACT|nr:penicillin-binding transpeptidase domain-containing protein [Pseudobdellovibrio exovorus]AGH96246.1 cell division protein [Pseudobdellovibrio exovorus JSS]
MKAKIITVFIFICFLWSLLIFRAAYLQFLPHDKLNSLQNRQFQTVVTLPARRGTVYDTNGKELAMSSPAYSLYADPHIIKNKKDVSQKLSKLLGQNPREIMTKIKDSKKRFVWLDRVISAEAAEEIRELKIKGLGLVEDWKRVYPNDSLLGSTLGFLGKEGQALEGLELHYDKELRGEKKKVNTRRDARGRPLVQDGLLFTEHPQGKEVKLTIDSDLQYFVEAEMAQTIRKHEAAGGWVVVLDAKTSAIRALASLPSYDPNNPRSASSFTRRNRAITDTFEPGSTLKTLVIADAIEKQFVKPNTKIFCENGHFKIGKRVIREADSSHARGTITVNEILAYSSNVGTAKIALKMGDDKLMSGLKSFGFAERMGVDLPGEAKGITVKLPWNDHLIANVSFGQGITVTPLQMANAYAVIANGGVLNRPYIVESMTDAETGEVVKTSPQEIRRVLSPETAAQMRLMLAGVTSANGTGTAARVPGYIVGGKTGTAQKVKPTGRGYMQGGYIGSFTGFIPANDPKYVIFVGIDHPKKNGYYGSMNAAPLFSKIASYAVRKSGVNPEILSEATITKATLSHNSKNKEQEDKQLSLGGERVDEILNNSVTKVAPYMRALTVREVLGIASSENIKVKFVGSGRVDSTQPEQGQLLDDSRQMTIILK